MQVCASSTEATCASLGLPERGLEFTETIAPWIAPDPLYSTYPTITHYPTKAPTTASQKQEAAANAPKPTIAVPKEPPLELIVTAKPSYLPTKGEDGQGKAPNNFEIKEIVYWSCSWCMDFVCSSLDINTKSLFSVWRRSSIEV
ncbi:hypothetical protein ACHAXR_003595 [Thalassiosira sp. AJA248-18]